ncbi:UNVERIFIED_CONTAM: Retrovirus-related Pol polyprotein from transposon RE2 [Sesamum indicum]
MADEAASSTMGHRTGEASSQYEKDMLFIHPSEHSQLALTSSPLDGTNFLVWQRAVYVSLGTKMKLGFIDGSFSKPAPGSLIFEQWRRVDLMVTSWLWNSMSKDIVESFMYCSTSRELWLAVQARYGRSNGPLIYQLQRELSSVTQQDLSLTAYLTKVTKLWNELNCLAPPPRCKCGGCTCGINEEIDQLASLTQLMQFLMGLHEVFSNERSQILMLDPLPTVEKAFSMVYAVEQQRMIHTSMEMNTNNVAYQLFSKGSKRDDGKYAQRQRITAAEKRTVAPVTRTSATQPFYMADHSAFIDRRRTPNCVRVLGIPQGDVTPLELQISAFLVSSSPSRRTPCSSIVDHCIRIFSSMQFGFLNPPEVLADVVSGLLATRRADTCFQLHGIPDWYKSLNEKKKKGSAFTANIDVKDEGVPDNATRMMTQLIQLLTKANAPSDPITSHANFVQFEEEFAGNTAKPMDQDSKKSLAIAHLFKNLYIFRPHPSFASAMDSVGSGLAMSCTQSDNQTLWHQRLGHASLQAVKHIKNIVFSVDNDKTPCDVCHKAMQSRVPFPVSSSYSNTPFELVHMDLWGPYAASNLLGGTYVLTLLDDYSRCLWTFILRQKSQVPVTLKHFCSLISNQFKHSIKTLRSDNGSEFFNRDCQTLCSDLGIIHQSSCTYTPQQNGRVERKHRHLLNVARALLFQASLPIRFWGDAILTATFLINRTPSKLLHWKTPFELLHGYLPTYNHLRVFGSLCFATNLNPHKSKFHPRALKCVFIGYSMHQKAYKLFDLDSRSVLFSRDVQFYEGVFPFSQNVPSSNPSPPLPLVSLDVDAVSSPSSLVSPQPVVSQSPYSQRVSPLPSIDASTRAISPVPRRSNRISRKPIWLEDFVSNVTNSCIVHPCNAAYTSFVASMSVLQEPKSYHEAMQHQEWLDAMKAEITALENNHTWSLVPLPAGKRPIGCKWVYKTKLRADGSVERYKARLVAKGFSQIAGVDYTDNFSPVAKPVTVRVLLAVAAAYGWPLQQMDVNNAFLHGYLEEDLYMQPPEGYSVQPGLVCKLERSLYGLKQASRQWNVELTLKLTDFGFSQSAYDHCLFTKMTDSGLVALLVYVDDIVVTAPSLELIQSVKTYLHSLFTIKDLGDARYFLGLEIARNSDGLYLAQTKYVHDIIRDTGMMSAKSASTPLPFGLKLSGDCGALLPQPDQYRRLIGRLLYLGFTRPDISHSVQQLSQFLNHPCVAHWKAALHVVRYLKGEPSKGLFFPATCSFELTAYCDADWASCTDSRRSLTGYCIFLGNALVFWKTKKQSTVSRSTTEAEYRSMASTVCELKWLSYLLSDFGIKLSLPVRLFCDNQAALHIMANPVFHERTKHIEIDCHVVRTAYKDGFLAPSHIRSSLQLVDLFTKSLSLKSFAFLLGKLGLNATSLKSPVPAASSAAATAAFADTELSKEDDDEVADSFLFDAG